MDNVKQETFSNFNYEVIKSIDERCVDVKCIYTYKGKIQAHYFSYVKSGNKPSSYYISKAKADMDKLVKSKSPASVAKKDLNGSKATFFKRHKKLIIGLTTAVLVAGVAAAATLVTMKYLKRPADPTAVTEEEIDKYLEGPSGNSYHLSPLFANKVLSEAIHNFSDNNLKEVESKMLSSMPAMTLIDAFFDKSPSNNGNITAQDYSALINDTSNFYTDNQFKSKNYYGSYLKGRLLEDKKQTCAATLHSFDTFTGLTNGITSSSKAEASTTIKHAENPDTSATDYPFITFESGKYIYDGYSGANMEFSDILNSHEDEKKSSEYIKMMITAAASYLTGLSTTDFTDFMDLFRVADDGTVFLKFERDEDLGPTYRLLDFPVKMHSEAVWYFKNVDKLGWVLDSFACDGLLMSVFENPTYTIDGTTYLLAPAYIDYNDKGEKQKNPICINKDKGFTKLSYGEYDKDSSIDDIKYEGDKSVRSPLGVNAAYITEKSGEKYLPAKDITIIRRTDNPDFNGYSLFGAVMPEPQCEKGSYLIFQYNKIGSQDAPTFLDYNKLKDYLDKDIFAEGIPVPDKPELILIKLNKAGWFTYEVVFNDKLQFSDFTINFHEGLSPVIDE